MSTSDGPIDIYDYMDGDKNTIRVFMASLQSNERARLQTKIDALKENGFGLLGSHLLTDTKKSHIKEIRVNGKVAVRLLCCRGPIGNQELTLLYGAFERDKVYIPKNALAIADRLRQLVVEDPQKRRKR